MGCMSRRESQSRVPGKHEQTNKNTKTKTKTKTKTYRGHIQRVSVGVQVKQGESVVSSIPYKGETGSKTFFFEGREQTPQNSLFIDHG